VANSAPVRAQRDHRVASVPAAATVTAVQQGPVDPGQSSHLVWEHRPQLDRPVIIAAFEGWNDAGDAASTAVKHLRDRLRATPFARIDHEDFYDFTTSRPEIELEGGTTRRIEWPRNEFSATAPASGGVDVIMLAGIEPQLKWRTFSSDVIRVATQTNARMIITLGALLAEVAHSRPVQLFGTTDDRALVDELGLEMSSYEGPTGIVGVLNAMSRDAGIPSASLWAAVPSYVPGSLSPKAALALVERVCDLLDIAVMSTDLEIASAAYERQITQLVTEDDETSSYVEQLEHRYDEEAELQPTAETFVEEVEQFLRRQSE
jgi:proteasome assembly chaperone (PAC2) family protein